MKKSLVFLMVFILLIAFSANFAAVDALPSQNVFGTIKEVSDDRITVIEGKYNSELVLLVSPETAIVDAVSGIAMSPKDRKSDDFVAYASPMMTASLPPQQPTYFVACDVPAGFRAPVYAKIESVKNVDGKVILTIMNGSMLVSVDKDTVLLPYKTKNIVSPGALKEGATIAVWLTSDKLVGKQTSAVATRVLLISSETKASISVVDKSVNNNAKRIYGNIPQIKIAGNAAAEKKLNGTVALYYNSAIKGLKSNEKLSFHYDTFDSENYLSLVMYKEIFSGNTGSSSVYSIVISKKTLKTVSLESVVGKNGFKSVDSQIRSQIKANPNAYFSGKDGFTSISKTQPFYFDNNGVLTVIFDKYSIAPGYMGNPTFSLNF